ncbi:MAG: DUF2079 domain-containing protein [Polyangiaceae bacterium]|nr:DUF2079 domain-containing protein [Polyangiaceae bacterium]
MPFLGSDPTGNRRRRFGSALRALTLAAVLGATLTLAFELARIERLLAPFLTSNELSMERRMAMLHHVAFGAGTTVLVAALVLILARRAGRSPERIERLLWFLSPAMLLPAVPMVLANLAWRGKHGDLLVVVVALLLATEVLAFRSFQAIPAGVAAVWRGAAHHVPRWLHRHGPFLLVIAGALFYAGFMSFYTVRWHYKLETGNYDLSINNNLIYGALHGKFLFSPVTMPEDPAAYGAIHVKLGTYVLLPLYALYPRAETLYVIQSALLGLGALPLFAFARRHVSVWTAVAIAFAYLIYYPMHSVNFTECNYIPTATFFVLATAWALEARRWVWFTLAFLAASLMREDIPIGLAVMGAFYAISGRRPRMGILMAAISTAWFVYLRFFWMENKGEWWFPSMYKGLWSPGEQGFGSVIKTLASNPAFVLTRLVEEDRLYYLLHLFVPLAFLPARRWYLWAAFIPGLVLTLLATDYKPPTMFSFQYVMHWTPYLFLAIPAALAAIASRPDDGRGRARAATAAMLVSSVALQYNYGAFPARDGSVKGGYKIVEFSFTDEERRRYAALEDVMELIPKDASVAATENVGPHVSSRVMMYAARYGPYDAEYYLASMKELGLKQTRPKLKAALESKRYGVLFRKADFALMKRGYDTSGNAQLLADWFGKVDPPEVDEPDPPEGEGR